MINNALPRLIPLLLLDGDRLIKTIRFEKPVYVGDPLNTLRILNDKQCREAIVIDRLASKQGIRFNLIEDMASECFMPLAYGGGIQNILDAERIIQSGIEKVVFNNALYTQPTLITDCAVKFGSQSVVASVDYFKSWSGKVKIRIHNTKVKKELTLQEFCLKSQDLGAGEIVLTSIDKEGTMTGLDVDCIAEISAILSIPLVAHGGCGNLEHAREVFSKTDASAVASGSLFIFKGSRTSVLISYPSRDQITILRSTPPAR